jgi:long-chain acyl-CoA synthetase
MVMDGYYGNEEATKRSIEPDGWLHSGDIATMGRGRVLHNRRP